MKPVFSSRSEHPLYRRALPSAAISVCTALLLILPGCSSDDDEKPNNGDPDVTLDPSAVEAVASFDSAGAVSEAGASLEPVDAVLRSQRLERFTTASDTPELVLYQWLQDQNDTSYNRYAAYAPGPETIRDVFETQEGQSSHALSADTTAVAYIESANCNLWYQSLNPTAEPVLINALLPEFACPRLPEVSANGDVVVFSLLVGAYADDGSLRYDSSDAQRFDVGLYRASTGEAIDLTSVGLPVDDPQLSDLQRNLSLSAISHDGQWLVFEAAFLPPLDNRPNPAEYSVGTWLYNTLTGEHRLLNTNEYRKTISDRLPIGGEDDAMISGDGTVLWYLETEGVSEQNNAAPSVLKRLVLSSGQTTTLTIDGTMSGLFSSDDGNRVLFLLDGELVVYRHDSGTLVHSREALKFCTDPESQTDCEFDSYRYVLGEPGLISGDGSVALLQPIPQRPDVSDPQNTMELLLLDVDTLALHRVAPDHDVLWVAVSADGNTVAWLDEQGDNGNYLDRERLMLLRR